MSFVYVFPKFLKFKIKIKMDGPIGNWKVKGNEKQWHRHNGFNNIIIDHMKRVYIICCCVSLLTSRYSEWLCQVERIDWLIGGLGRVI